jgi:GTP cyclohydrolase I
MDEKQIQNVKDFTRQLLENIGENPERQGLTETPRRVANAWDYFSHGYEMQVEDLVNDALFDVEYDEMITIKDIDFFSMCEHHLLPFFGRAHVAYIPDKKVIGLSKIPRIVEMFARRLQVQERMTQQIAHTIDDVLSPQGIGVIIEGRHMCMQMRGVEKQNSYATTSAMFGAFADDQSTRQEFLTLINFGQI